MQIASFYLILTSYLQCLLIFTRLTGAYSKRAILISIASQINWGFYNGKLASIHVCLVHCNKNRIYREEKYSKYPIFCLLVHRFHFFHFCQEFYWCSHRGFFSQPLYSRREIKSV